MQLGDHAGPFVCGAPTICSNGKIAAAESATVKHPQLYKDVSHKPNDLGDMGVSGWAGGINAWDVHVSGSWGEERMWALERGGWG